MGRVKAIVGPRRRWIDGVEEMSATFNLREWK